MWKCFMQLYMQFPLNLYMGSSSSLYQLMGMRSCQCLSKSDINACHKINHCFLLCICNYWRINDKHLAHIQWQCLSYILYQESARISAMAEVQEMKQVILQEAAPSDQVIFISASYTCAKTRPDTRQSSCRQMGRSSNAKNTCNSKILWMDWGIDQPRDQHGQV